jgi:hypothetical protein
MRDFRLYLSWTKGEESMATKREELEMAARGEGCLGKADDDEPVFIIRAQNRFAPEIVFSWARWVWIAGADRESPEIKEAEALFRQMEAWQITHSDRVKLLA